MTNVFQNSTFDLFWKQIILPSIKCCIHEMDNSLKQQIKFKCVDIDQYKTEIETMFKKKREWLKREYLPNKGEEAVLDFHKLGAILCRCIIGCKPFSFNMKKAQKLFQNIAKNDDLSNEEKLNLEINNIYVNYKCAFLVYAGVAYIDLLYWANQMSQTTDDPFNKEVYSIFRDYLLNEKELQNYKKSLNHDDYISSMIVSFMKNDILLRDFDYLSIASAMFQWQMYIKQKILIDILTRNKLPESKDLMNTIEDLI